MLARSSRSASFPYIGFPYSRRGSLGQAFVTLCGSKNQFNNWERSRTTDRLSTPARWRHATLFSATPTHLPRLKIGTAAVHDRARKMTVGQWDWFVRLAAVVRITTIPLYILASLCKIQFKRMNIWWWAR